MPSVWVAYCGALKARLCNATDGGRAVTLNSAKLVKQRRDSVAARALSAPAWMRPRTLRCVATNRVTDCVTRAVDRLCYGGPKKKHLNHLVTATAVVLTSPALVVPAPAPIVPFTALVNFLHSNPPRNRGVNKPETTSDDFSFSL